MNGCLNFLAIVVRMYYRDHAPPQFYATYGDYDRAVDIETGITEGRFPRRALAAVIEWFDQQQDELRENWERARREEPVARIEPLE